MSKILNQKQNVKNKHKQKDPEPKKENRKRMHKKNSKCLNKVEKFCQQVRKGPYFIFTVCRWCFHKRSIRLFEHEKYILTGESYFLVRSFDSIIPYVIHVINSFLDMKSHVKQSSMK